VLDRNGMPVRGQIAASCPPAPHSRPSGPPPKLDFDISDVFTMVANAVTLIAFSPRGQERTLRDNPDLTRPAPDRGSA